MIKTEHGGDIYSHPDALDFSANINPLGPPQAVVDAAIKSIEKINVYPDQQNRELCKEIADWEKVSPEQILVGNGAAELIYSIILAKKPHKALVVTPGFSEYEKALELVGCQIVEFPLLEYLKSCEDSSSQKISIQNSLSQNSLRQNSIPQKPEEKDYCQNEDMATRIEKAITPDIDMMILVNPNNPTGFLFDKKVCRAIMEACQQNHVLLLMDECFMDFVETKDQVHCMELFSETKGQTSEPHNQNDGLIVLKAFTKIFAIPGVRLGYAIYSNVETASYVKKYLQPWNVSVIAEACGIAALQEARSTDYLERSRQHVKKEKEILRKALLDAGMEVYPSAANYLFFKADVDLYQSLLKKGILIRSCANYRGLGKGYYRIAVRRQEENESFCKALESICSGNSNME